MTNVPPGITRQVGTIRDLGKLGREIGEVALDVAWAGKPDERKAAAQKLRALADRIESIPA